MRTSIGQLGFGIWLFANMAQAALISDPEKIRQYLTDYPAITNAISATVLTKGFATVTALEVSAKEFAKDFGEAGIRYECQVSFVATLSSKMVIPAVYRFYGRCTGLPR